MMGMTIFQKSPGGLWSALLAVFVLGALTLPGLAQDRDDTSAEPDSVTPTGEP